MQLTLYQVDAFTDKLFGGNPAAVIPLEKWLDVGLMQKIAMENNLSETVFFVPSLVNDTDFEIRWFTPLAEINLCGHATLASAYVLFEILNFNKSEIRFSSHSGVLKVKKENALIIMDFPSWKPERLDIYPDNLRNILSGAEIVGVYRYRDILVELENEDAVKACTPDLTLMKMSIDKMIITAPGKPRPNDPTGPVDFVSRFFAPAVGVDEDPVTGSAHSQLIPFWSEKLGKNKMRALQLSKRGGELWCEQLNAERVTMAGNCVYYMKAVITV
ncbi:PhzF family phenazine biosynthesis protein [Ferruginibacter sp.]